MKYFQMMMIVIPIVSCAMPIKNEEPIANRDNDPLVHWIERDLKARARWNSGRSKLLKKYQVCEHDIFKFWINQGYLGVDANGAKIHYRNKKLNLLKDSELPKYIEQCSSYEPDEIRLQQNEGEFGIYWLNWFEDCGWEFLENRSAFYIQEDKVPNISVDVYRYPYSIGFAEFITYQENGKKSVCLKTLRHPDPIIISVE